jgi:uncharacterized protein (TIGR02145 family)
MTRNPLWITASLALFAFGILSSCDSSTSSSGSGNGTLDSNTYKIPWNTSINYGVLTDSRDGQTYKTVKIGTQTWMAQNLNYKVDSSWCFNDSASNCSNYGRLYHWTALMDLNTSYDTTSWQATFPHQGVCPNGWHVPSNPEWTTLMRYVDSAKSGTELKSTSGWLKGTWTPSGNQNGTDIFGFRILPAGKLDLVGNGDKVFYYFGLGTQLWSASDAGGVGGDRFMAWCWEFLSGYAEMSQAASYKSFGPSYARCLKDD